MTNAARRAEVEALIREIQRYLAYVDAVRAKRPKQQKRQREDGNV